jgi:hypothetical protein
VPSLKALATDIFLATDRPSVVQAVSSYYVARCLRKPM